MSGKSKKKQESEVLPFGGLELEITDEEIDAMIDKYPYVMGKLKDC